MHSKVVVIGSGPAGYTAGIYTARAGLETTLFTGQMTGGQLMLTQMVENYPGFAEISGIDLMDNFQKQALHVGVNLKYERITKVNFSKRPFVLHTDMKQKVTADCVIVATGSTAKWLNVPGEDKFKGRGVSICAVCDGFFYKDKTVAVVGGGNAAVYEALHLAGIAKEVLLIVQADKLSAEKTMIQKVLSNKKIVIRWDSNVKEFLGRENLTDIRVVNKKTKQESLIPVDGVFIAIGTEPNSALFKDQLALTQKGYIKTNCKTLQTSVEGVFACGDVQDEIYRQAVISAGTGCIAALSAEKFLNDHL